MLKVIKEDKVLLVLVVALVLKVYKVLQVVVEVQDRYLYILRIVVEFLIIVERMYMQVIEQEHL